MTSIPPTSEDMWIAGYIPLLDHGFALPLYLAKMQGNAWHAAIPEVEGDHGASIVGFELLVPEVTRLLEDGYEVSVGDLWQDVFLWDDRIFVGTPRDIFDELAPFHDALKQSAPLSFLDLALGARATVAADAASHSLAFLQGRFGPNRGSACFREVVIRPGVLRELHRQWQLHSPRNDSDSGLPDTLRNFAIREPSSARFAVELGRESLTLLGGSEAEIRLAEAVALFGEAIGTSVQLSQLSPDLDNANGRGTPKARHAADRTAHMVRRDPLTGLPDRLHLMEDIAAALEQTRAQGSQCAMLMVDLDRFKTINDSLGHVAGDHLLREIARCFETVISEEMTAGRWGGDEFAIVVPDVGSHGELDQLCLAVVSSVQGPFLYREQRLFVGASIGVAVGPRDGDTVEELVRNADLALLHAKEGSGNDIRFYEPALFAVAEERRLIELALHNAIDARELSVVYQPLVDAQTSRIESFEALLRWHNPELGQIPPAKFIPIAEEAGHLGKIGEWVLRLACREAAAWPEDVGVAVNVSPRQLRDPGFIVILVSALTQAGLEPSRLELEVTESVFLELTGTAQKVLQQIQSLGVKLAMDDFGTGYSSLGYLRRAEFDTLKIDRSFIQSISANDPQSTAIIRAAIALAGSLGMKTVAEGVSTEEQLQLVRALGVDRIQGYIFSRPVTSSAVKTMLEGDGLEWLKQAG